MPEMESQTQQDELLPRVTFVATAPTDESLIAAAKSGDHPAFLELWTRHSSRALKTAYRITGNRYDAEDAFQDTWMRAYMHLNAFDGRTQFSTWLGRIAINAAGRLGTAGQTIRLLHHPRRTRGRTGGRYRRLGPRRSAGHRHGQGQPLGPDTTCSQAHTSGIQENIPARQQIARGPALPQPSSQKQESKMDAYLARSAADVLLTVTRLTSGRCFLLVPPPAESTCHQPGDGRLPSTLKRATYDHQALFNSRRRAAGTNLGRVLARRIMGSTQTLWMEPLCLAVSVLHSTTKDGWKETEELPGS